MIRLMPGFVEDVAAWQARLEDLAAKGWFYVPSRTFFYLASFRRGEPRTVRYRLEPTAKKEKCPDQDRRDTYRALGWAYVDTISKTMHLWRCDDPEAPELHTDPETEARAYDRLSQQERVSQWIGIGTLLLCAVLIGVNVSASGGANFSHMVQSWSPLWRIAAWIGFFAAAISMAGWQVHVLRRRLKTMKAGVEVPHRRPYRRSCVLAMVINLLWVFYFVSLWANLMEPNRRPFEPAETFDEPVPYVTEKGPGEVHAIHWDNWLTTDQWWTYEDMGGWETQNRYYRLRFPWTADNLVDSILAGYQENGWPVTAWEVPGLDEAWVSTRSDYGYWFLVVRLGDQVWRISTGTTEPTAELAARYAAVLAEFQ